MIMQIDAVISHHDVKAVDSFSILATLCAAHN